MRREDRNRLGSGDGTRHPELGLAQWAGRVPLTCPHPVVPRRPPGRVLSALPLTVLDRARDRLQQLDERIRGRHTARIAATNRLLATAARRVEQLGLLRRGERPETSR